MKDIAYLYHYTSTLDGMKKIVPGINYQQQVIRRRFHKPGKAISEKE